MRKELESSLDCPVCLEFCKPPTHILQCPEGHLGMEARPNSSISDFPENRLVVVIIDLYGPYDTFLQNGPLTYGSGYGYVFSLLVYVHPCFCASLMELISIQIQNKSCTRCFLSTIEIFHCLDCVSFFELRS
jgi:hypothetical protein